MLSWASSSAVSNKLYQFAYQSGEDNDAFFRIHTAGHVAVR